MALGRHGEAGVGGANGIRGGEAGMKRGEMSFAPTARTDENHVRFGPRIRSFLGCEVAYGEPT
jgi:hypothetical protein